MSSESTRPNDHAVPPSQQNHGLSPYWKLAISLSISVVVMFVLTMSMIAEWSHFYVNASNAYMALIMVFPMGIIMMLVMWGMFTNKKLNIAIIAGLTVLFFVALFMGRAGVFVGNEQFLKSMIPHHSRAILVCNESDISDPEIKTLCDGIIEAQEKEIAQMKDILKRY